MSKYYENKSHIENPFQELDDLSITLKEDDIKLFTDFVLMDLFSINKRSITLFKYMLSIPKEKGGNIFLDRNKFLEAHNNISNTLLLDSIKQLLNKGLIVKAGIKNTYFINENFNFINNKSIKLSING